MQVAGLVRVSYSPFYSHLEAVTKWFMWVATDEAQTWSSQQ